MTLTPEQLEVVTLLAGYAEHGTICDYARFPNYDPDKGFYRTAGSTPDGELIYEYRKELECDCGLLDVLKELGLC